MDAGYHTVESIAYTYVSRHQRFPTIALFEPSASIHVCLGSLYDGYLRPKRLLEQIKGISEQKATKVLVEGKSLMDQYYMP